VEKLYWSREWLYEEHVVRGKKHQSNCGRARCSLEYDSETLD